MYIVAIAWLYVVVMMAVTEQSVTAAIVTFLLYGVFPLSIILYLMGTPARRKRRRAADGVKPVGPDNGTASESKPD